MMGNNYFRKVWVIPVLLMADIMFGLLAALLGTGNWYVFSWLSLSIPIVVILYKAWPPQRD
jgi:hypothetical protein